MRWKSFQYAIEGILTAVREEPHFRIHIIAGTIVIALAVLLEVNVYSWGLLTVAIASVFITEAINTAIENLCDLYSEDYHPTIKKIKDVAAGAVLLAVVFAVVVGGIVFIPYVL